MKKTFIIALIVVTITSQAQVFHERIGFDLESIADIDIGWMKMYKNTKAPGGKQLGNRTYSAKQIGYSLQFIEWMQQSYLPKGCLGDAAYYQNYIPKFSSTNSRLGNAISMHGNALPLLYGAYSKMYMFLKKDIKGQFVPLHNFAEFWHIAANQVEHISNQVSFISSAETYYFILPDFKASPRGYDPGDKAASNLMGFNNHKNFAAHRHFYIRPKVIHDFSQYVVIMTKDKELPFEKITIGEFLTQAEKQFPAWQTVDPVPVEQFAVAQRNLARLKEKYKTRWNDIAELDISATDINLYYFVNANEDRDDMFDNKDIYGKETTRTTFPVLKVKKAALDLCKTDQPQWLVIRWSMGMPTREFNNHLHESILNNFNFDYVYNYFFDPEKVKGQAYKPLRSPSYKETVVVKNLSDASKSHAADKNVFFFEDFSATVVNKKPVGWQTRITGDGSFAVVTNPGGLEGNWVELRGHYINAAHLKNPLPQNFTLSYDLAVPQNFTWGAKGLTLRLSTEAPSGDPESFLKVKLRPGYDGRDGEATVEAKFPSPPGYLNETKWYVASGFSNNKKYNRITVVIKKTGEKLQVFLDKTKIAEYEKAIPLTYPFNALSFDCNGNSGENDKFFITNIKITRD